MDVETSNLTTAIVGCEAEDAGALAIRMLNSAGKDEFDIAHNLCFKTHGQCCSADLLRVQ
eukprot:3018203-Amphidinium_carterae.1